MGKEDRDNKVKLLWEDRFFLVVYKPAGMLSVPAETEKGGPVLSDWIRDNIEIDLSIRDDLRDGFSFKRRMGVVHRLDKDTSGLVLVAKSEAVFLKLQGFFKKREVEKEYLALVWGETSSTGEVKMPIERDRSRFGRFRVGIEGKEALTKFRRIGLKRNQGKFLSLLEVFPWTGRTHQIRVHFSYLGWPIVGDGLYGRENLPSQKRLFLHAQKIVLPHPISRQRLEFKSPCPADLWLLWEAI